ncbi:MAG: UDP-galactopyranose mutase [Nanopusillaceae archaeon]
MFDYIIVGAGISGIVVAERIANVLNKKVLIIEKRNHIGGNCFDYLDKTGIYIHKYGPHIFHTNYKEVFEYLSNFTEWYYYTHRVLVYVDGKKIPLPINFISIEELFPEHISKNVISTLLSNFRYGEKVSILELLKNEKPDLQFIGKYIYKKVFLNYTKKQWGKSPEEIDPDIVARVPIVLSKDSRYFQDRYQGIPLEGYTKMFERMLMNSNIKLLLNTDYKEIIKLDFECKKIYFFGQEYKGKLIFTGKIDELFNYKFGILPYRSLNFELKFIDKEFFQEVAVVNYPNDYDFTRITEFKHFLPTDSHVTVLAYEYPKDYQLDSEPFYPLLTNESKELYYKYLEFSKNFNNLYLLGRLGEYRYYDMDDAVKRALELFEEIR